MGKNISFRSLFSLRFSSGQSFLCVDNYKDSNSTVSSIAHSSARTFLVLLGVSKGHNYQNQIAGHYLVEDLAFPTTELDTWCHQVSLYINTLDV